jgi:hypothetical protein
MARVVTLSEGEHTALLDYMQGRLLKLTNQRGTVDGHEEFHAVADAHAALASTADTFRLDLPEGHPERPEVVEVGFSDLALARMGRLREEVQTSLNEGRGTVEINGEFGPGETFLLFVLATVATAAPVVPLTAADRAALQEMVSEELDGLTKGNQIDSAEVGHGSVGWTHWRELAERLSLLDDFRGALANIGWPDGEPGALIVPTEGCDLRLTVGADRVLRFLKARLNNAVADHDGADALEEERRAEYRAEIAVLDRALGGGS